MTWGSLRARVAEEAGLITVETRQALKTIWRILCAAVPATLWELRNKRVHEGKTISPTETAARAWGACAK